ncbi:MAG: adenylosuccinate synthase [candidate division WOR-3 bacterium]|nr:adenylosuccinate synthase [candidate division WOR-3 bacterium]MCX7948251.1 adenylosuccinate synthase [candidate division WOR-3 bacterium]MDW8151228.1 adenylosuccinate synthase [candidate division WOR-3 bacterium]
MENISILGLQWGDEGKGKIVDYFAKDYRTIVRFQGGPNAGHTVYVNNKKYTFHQLPSGLLWGNKRAIIGSGVVINLELLKKEIEQLSDINFELLIDYRANIILPYHILEDEYEEKLDGIGSTKKGISQAYRDKYARVGVRVFDILDEKRLRRALERSYKFNSVLVYGYKEKMIDFDEVYEYLLNFRKFLKEHSADVQYEIMNQKEGIIFEGAQGTLLDINFGTYPFVTSSHTIVSSIGINLGIPMSMVNKNIGVFKAYTTRVGKGPFPTELNDEIGDYLRNVGNEYGSTTGRPRRCGWLDLVLLKYAVFLNDIHELVLTKLDVLFGLKEINVCVAYEYNGRILDFPILYNLESVKPVYKKFKGFDNFKGASEFISFIESYLNRKIKYVSYGLNRDEITIF